VDLERKLVKSTLKASRLRPVRLRSQDADSGGPGMGRCQLCAGTAEHSWHPSVGL
jgi:hypothetical protein